MNSLRRRCRKEEALRKPPKAFPKKRALPKYISRSTLGQLWEGQDIFSAPSYQAGIG